MKVTVCGPGPVAVAGDAPSKTQDHAVIGQPAGAIDVSTTVTTCGLLPVGPDAGLKSAVGAPHGVPVGVAVGATVGGGVGVGTDGGGIGGASSRPAIWPARIRNSDVAPSGMFALEDRRNDRGQGMEDTRQRDRRGVAHVVARVRGLPDTCRICRAVSEDGIGRGRGRRTERLVDVVVDERPVLADDRGGIGVRLPCLGIQAGEVRTDARCVLEDDPAVERSTEVDAEQEDQEQHRHEQRELDDALAPRSLVATAHE